MTITDWPTHERPRERLLEQGPQALSEAELLAILWGHGTHGLSALDLARQLLNHYGSLAQLYESSYNNFTQHPGIGATKYCQLHAALELSRRYWRTPLQRDTVIGSFAAVQDFLLTHLRNPAQEIFAALFLDNKHRVIQFEKLFFGSINIATVHPRILVQRALAHNASAVIVAHNHPSGNAEPSQADLELTELLRSTLALVEVDLLDHIVIGANDAISVTAIV